MILICVHIEANRNSNKASLLSRTISSFVRKRNLTIIHCENLFSHYTLRERIFTIVAIVKEKYLRETF